MPAFLKWAGGKSALVPAILERLPEDLRGVTYYEPFLGSGAVFWAIQGRCPTSCILSDTNPALINTWRCIQQCVEEVLSVLAPWGADYLRMDARGRADFYQHIREETFLEDYAQAAQLLFLNRTCFNGLYRVNKKGQFNVPHGRYARPSIVRADLLRDCARQLAHVSIRCAPYTDLRIEGDAVLYIDPPYAPVKEGSFTEYTAEGFGEADQVRLATLLKALAEDRVPWVASNSDTRFIRQLYDHPLVRMETVTSKRSINRDAKGRGPVSELLLYSHARG